MNSKSIGESSEAQVLAVLLKAYKKVLLPFGDNQRYDLVVDTGSRFVRVQIKTGRVKNGSLAFETSSITTKNGDFIHKNYTGQIDYFAVYWREKDLVLFVPIEKTGKRGTTLRFNPTKAYNTTSVNDFVFPKNDPFVP